MTIQRPMFPPGKADECVVLTVMPAGRPAVPSENGAVPAQLKSSRRRFLSLLGLGAATGAIAGSALALSPLSDRLPLPNRSERRLARLGKMLDRMERRFGEALDARRQARARAVALYPATPNELVVPPGDIGNWWFVESEEDVDGAIVYAMGEHRPARRLATVRGLQQGLTETDGRTREARHMKQLLPIAQAYEAAREHAVDVSGYRDARYTVRDQALAIERLAGMIFRCGCSTLEGLEVKARALQAAAAVDERDLGIAYRVKLQHAETLASDLLLWLRAQSPQAGGSTVARGA